MSAYGDSFSHVFGPPDGDPESQAAFQAVGQLCDGGPDAWTRPVIYHCNVVPVEDDRWVCLDCGMKSY